MMSHHSVFLIVESYFGFRDERKRDIYGMHVNAPRLDQSGASRPFKFEVTGPAGRLHFTAACALHTGGTIPRPPSFSSSRETRKTQAGCF